MANRGISYINLYGSVKSAWRRHREVMVLNDLPYVNYTTFKGRLDKGWNLYDAIHTPAKTKYRDSDRRRKAWFIRAKDKVSNFFRYLFNL